MYDHVLILARMIKHTAQKQSLFIQSRRHLQLSATPVTQSDASCVLVTCRGLRPSIGLLFVGGEIGTHRLADNWKHMQWWCRRESWWSFNSSKSWLEVAVPKTHPWIHQRHLEREGEWWIKINQGQKPDEPESPRHKGRFSYLTSEHPKWSQRQSLQMNPQATCQRHPTKHQHIPSSRYRPWPSNPF